MRAVFVVAGDAAAIAAVGALPPAAVAAAVAVAP
jgi:hypothetical protein